MSSNLYVILEYVARIGLASSLGAHWELTGSYLGARHSCGYEDDDNYNNNDDDDDDDND